MANPLHARVCDSVCSWQREVAPSTPVEAPPPPVPCPTLPLDTLALCLCRRFIIPLSVAIPLFSTVSSSFSSAAQLTFFFRGSFACQISQHISNSRQGETRRDELGEVIPSACHAPCKAALRVCVCVCVGLRLVWQLQLAVTS